LASNSWSSSLQLWEPLCGKLLLTTKGRSINLERLRFSPDDKYLTGEFKGDKLVSWEVTGSEIYRTMSIESAQERGAILSLSPSPVDRLIVAGTENGFGLWNVDTGREVAFVGIGVNTVADFDSTGSLLNNSGLGLYRRQRNLVQEPSEQCEFGPPQKISLPGSELQVASAKDGKLIATANLWGALVVDRDHPDRLLRFGPHDDTRSVALSPDGRWAATGSNGLSSVVKVWNVASGQLEAELPSPGGARVVFSSDGKCLATCGDKLRLWQTGSWQSGLVLDGGYPMAFSADGRMLAAEIGIGIVKLIDTVSGEELASLENPDRERAEYLAFTSDGEKLTWGAASKGPVIHVWDLKAIRQRLEILGLDWQDPAKHSAPDSPGHATNHSKKSANLPVVVEIVPNEQANFDNNRAWRLAMSSAKHLSDPTEAVQAAQQAVDRVPQSGNYWNTLGITQYRARHWREAIVALTKSIELSNGFMESDNTFFLAMAHWQLGEKETAQKWYRRAIDWTEHNRKFLDANPSAREELERFRFAAEDLLEIRK